MDLRPLALVGAVLCCAASAAAEPPRVTANALPGWWPASQFGPSSTVTAEDYGEAELDTSTNPTARPQPLRGRHWKIYLSRTAEEAKLNPPPDADAKWRALLGALTDAGFKVVNLVQRTAGAYPGVFATLQKGAGPEATWLRVELHQPFRQGTMEAVELAPNPLAVELPRPGPTPDKVGDKEDLPYLPPPPREQLVSTQHFNQPLDYRPGDRREEPVGSGQIIKTYKVDPTISRIAFHDAYAAALKNAGWTVSPEPSTTVFAHYDKNGRDIYVALAHGVFYVADQGRELASSLTSGCKAAVYGINFDFNKATLRPDSEPTLRQVLKLLQDDGKLQVEIGGHTDNVGTHDYNLKLSDERAAAMKDWLVAHGVASSRLTSHGYGDTQPLVPNNSELNRAKNRRVELKKPNCN